MKNDASIGQAANAIAFFPLASRRDLVRRSAVELDNCHGSAAVDYWRSTCRALGAELLALGCPEEDMRAEIMDFQAAVQMELMWLHRAEEARG
ncbi:MULTISPECIES: DUF6074 family protein [Alphaproteobacteria]|uniref:Uncharacterized protein n=2 Tax=Alphaproteobacteria TaxID=28211 RepID=A0A512HN37_9HYPH|nr:MULTISPECIES: DUF6074 family protein [Alphaproteobacteria]GEO86810.1 hypothetical protein RNA01_37420 [Ciceribacter naphthalenivorans]GLR23390.1 hypothetical protein GCM10007920_31810 [Ciceribacter naphthalenivorans]GLT06246.1 hypothetical protein GCM10007926_31810 [Sphingomonas psychrolutea]